MCHTNNPETMTASAESQNPPRCASNIPSSPTKVPDYAVPPVSKKLLPVAGFFVAFATVMTILILYMDNTAMKHYQFTQNLNKDIELNDISQDDPQLILYLRQVALTTATETHHKPLQPEDNIPEDTQYVLKLLNEKKDGIFVESGAYSDGKSSKTEILERKYDWKGLLIQPDPRHYFNLRRHNRVRSQAVHACLSPMPYPREITLHQESEVKINSLHSNSLEDPDWLVTRVKCFPLYSLLLAMNVTNVDYFSLESEGTELQILETVPFERVKIEIIAVHLQENNTEKNTIKKFLSTKKYKFMESFNNTHIFMINRVKI